MNAALIRLFKLLAQLFPGEDESAILMAQAGISAGRIHTETSARVRWFAIVSEAAKAGQVGALLAAATNEYPEHDELLALRAEMGVVAEEARRMTVLAIWPTVPGQLALDTSGEAAAIDAVGVDIVALRGAKATRDGVLREWLRLRPTAVEIGAHGVDGQILLSDGAVGVGWFVRILRLHQPQLVLLLACDIGDSGAFDIPDAFVRAGVADVIAVSDKILDTDAVLFARVFWESITAPMSVSAAYEIAKLTLSDAGAAMIRHREGKVTA